MLHHLYAPAKVNLHLEVGSARDDGYHSLRSLCIKINLFDHLAVEVTKEGYTLVGLDIPNLVPEQDLLYQAMVFYQQLSGQQFGLNIKIKKSIPMCGGLGGGSSDAGVLLHFLNEYFNRCIPLADLAEKSAWVGADIPLFVYPYAAVWVEGIGEKVTQIPPQPLDMLLCFPHYGISTKEAYTYVDRYVESLGRLNYTDAMQAWQGPVSRWPFFNTFSQKLSREYPFLARDKKILQQCGFDYVEMSGSGSTIFAIGPEEKIQAVLHHDLSHEFASWMHVKTLMTCESQNQV